MPRMTHPDLPGAVIDVTNPGQVELRKRRGWVPVEARGGLVPVEHAPDPEPAAGGFVNDDLDPEDVDTDPALAGNTEE